MNDTFSFTRFGLLLRKHLIEEYRQYLILSAGIFAILIVFNGLTTMSSLNTHGQYDFRMPEVSFIMAFILGGCIFASLTYHFFQNTPKGVRFLQLPASQLEKIVVMFVVTQLIYVIVFLALYYLNNWLMCTIYNSFRTIPPNTSPERLQYFHAALYNLRSDSAKQTIVLFMVLSAVCHFGSLAFKKTAFIKMAICIVVILVLINWLNYIFMKSIIPEPSMPGGLFFTNSVRLGDEEGSKGFVMLPDTWTNTINYILPGVVYISFWMAGYYKLKEKQV